ncbi:MAG: GxxExxY protein [Akkermansiaceae bacterium]
MSDNDLTYSIIGAAMKVHNELGPGLREKPYENALYIELRNLGYHVEQQYPFPIRYQNHIVGDCIPDLVIPKQLIIEGKSVDRLSENESAQVLNYLRIANITLGLLLNFKPHKLEVKRFSR